MGDAAGASLEFVGRKVTPDMARRAMTMPGGGSLRIGPGQVTDDSEMAMALLQGLCSEPRPHVHWDEVANAYVDWYASGPFDIGMTCRTSLGDGFFHRKEHGKEGLYDVLCQAAQRMSTASQANGALMRLTPLMVWAADLPEEAFVECMRKDAMMTHPNPVCQDCNVVYGMAVRHLLEHPQDGEGAWKKAEAILPAVCPEVQAWLAMAPTDLETLDCTRNMGHVKHAFVLAFHCLYHRMSFEDAIQWTLEKGGDTDTNAAIVGGMMGAYWGVAGIPIYMKDPVLAYDCTVEPEHHGYVRPSAYHVHTNLSRLFQALVP